MDALVLVVWSMVLGGIAAVTTARLCDFLAHPGLSRLRAVSYHFSVFMLVLVLSGVLSHTHAPAADRLHVLQVLAGPLCVGLSALWIHGWLRAAQRDHVMALGLRGAALLLPLGGLLALLLPRERQLAAAAAISLSGSAVMLWLTLRGWRMGDRMALVMASGCALALPAIAGLYALAMEAVTMNFGQQVVLALSAALSNGLTGFVLWRRDRHAWKARRRAAAVSVLDPVTKLAAGASLIRKLVRALDRRRRTRCDGALLAVIVFDVDRVAAQVGTAGVNEMWIVLAGRIRRQVGVVNPVGRYWDHCFVAMVEAIPSLPWLRTLALKLSASLQHPIEVTGFEGTRVQVHADLGVGVVHLRPGIMEVEDVLDEAQRMARAARNLRARAAIRDPSSAAIVPVVQVELARPRTADRGFAPPQRVLR